MENKNIENVQDVNEFGANQPNKKVTVAKIRRLSDKFDKTFTYDKDESPKNIIKDLIVKLYSLYHTANGCYQIKISAADDSRTDEYLLLINRYKVTHIIEMDEYTNLVNTYIN